MPAPQGATVLHNATAAASNGSYLYFSGGNHVSIQLSGTWAGTVTFEGTVDGTNWVAIPFSNIAGTSATTATTNDIYRITNVLALSAVRARVSTYTSGALTAWAIATSNS